MISQYEKTPLWETIFNDIRDLIIDNQMAPNEHLPSENELCLRYQTTRRTVREALKQLEQDGVIYSLPKRGYFVQQPALGMFTIENTDFIRESTSQLKDIKIVSVDDEIQQQLGIAPRKIAVAITRINLHKDTLYGVEIKYIPYDKGYPSIESEIQFAVFPDPANEKTFSFSYHAQVSITAALPPADVASVLGCNSGEPLLLVKRLYVTQDGTPIGFSKQYLLQPYGELHGVSGYVQNKRKAYEPVSYSGIDE